MARAFLLGVGVVVLASLGSVRAVGDDTTANDFSGVYACEGMNPDGTPYEALVEIIKLRDTYLVRWTMPDDVRVVGVGVVKAGVFAVSYFAGTPAVVVYSAETDGRLEGTWTMGGAEGLVFSETLKKIPPDQRKPKPTKQAPLSKPGVAI
jgi:hypothetical protein